MVEDSKNSLMASISSENDGLLFHLLFPKWGKIFIVLLINNGNFVHSSLKVKVCVIYHEIHTLCHVFIKFQFFFLIVSFFTPPFSRKSCFTNVYVLHWFTNLILNFLTFLICQENLKITCLITLQIMNDMLSYILRKPSI